MFERFTDSSKRVVVLAREEARLLHHDYMGTEHLLLGLIGEGNGLAATLLAALDISLEVVRSNVERIVGRGDSAPSGHVPFTDRAKQVLELAVSEAADLGQQSVGTEHILLGVIHEGKGTAVEILVGLNVDLALLRQHVIDGLDGGPPTWTACPS